jgi:hypothetical protein
VQSTSALLPYALLMGSQNTLIKPWTIFGGIGEVMRMVLREATGLKHSYCR